MAGTGGISKRNPSDPVQPCVFSERNENGWVRIEARYADRWKTPMAGAEFKLWINEALYTQGKLLDFTDVGLTIGQPLVSDADKKMETAWYL